MAGWSTAAPVIKQLLADLAADPAKVTPDSVPFTAEWQEGQRSFTHDVQKISLLLKVTTVSIVGEDELRRVFTESPAQFVSTVWGLRRVTLQVQAQMTERTDGDFAMVPLMRIMTGLRRDASVAALQAVDVDIDIGKAVKANFKDSGRVVSAANLDLFLFMLVSDQDPVESGWIETIELTSHVQNTPGVDIPLPLQMDHEILPSP
jgi:hypothetical protein